LKTLNAGAARVNWLMTTTQRSASYDDRQMENICDRPSLNQNCAAISRLRSTQIDTAGDTFALTSVIRVRTFLDSLQLKHSAKTDTQQL